LLTKERALEALRSYRSSGGDTDFGAFLVDQDFVSEEDLAELLLAQADSGRRDEAAHSPAPAPDLGNGTGPEAPFGTPDSGNGEGSVDRSEPAPVTATAATPSLDCPPGVALEDLLRQACALGVSDLHLHSGAPMKIRLHGLLHDATEIIDAAEAERLLYHLLTDEQRAVLENDLQVV